MTMLFTILMVLYVVLAVFMIGLILVQRGAGAAAGSGFGAGASATVFGARGASSFLTKATKWLAIAFFLLTLGMAMYVQRAGIANRTGATDLGVMSGVGAPAAADVPAAPQSAAPAGDVPAAGQDVPVPAPAEPAQQQAAPASDAPAQDVPAQPAPAPPADDEGNE
jgi:preprotein translocase subunit SecG